MSRKPKRTRRSDRMPIRFYAFRVEMSDSGPYFVFFAFERVPYWSENGRTSVRYRNDYWDLHSESELEELIREMTRMAGGKPIAIGFNPEDPDPLPFIRLDRKEESRPAPI